MPLTRAYYKGLTFLTGRVHSPPTFPEALNCIACGKFHPEHATDRVVPFVDAIDAMTDAGPKVVFVAESV